MRHINLVLVVTALAGCAATGPQYSPPDTRTSTDATVVVYRTSQIGGTAGTWVPSKLEVNTLPPRKLPADSFVILTVPPGEVSLSATNLVNFRYAEEGRMTLHEKVTVGDVAYFRLLSIFGQGCDGIYEKPPGGASASATQQPRPDWTQTTCFQRVPESLALKELIGLHRAD
jgi:hypothetical protein